MIEVAVWSGCKIVLHQGDITQLDVDAIVNAANAHLLAGGGVCGAIHRRGGPVIARECAAAIARRGGPLKPGEAEITSGGNLPARFVIHAVGPVYDEDLQAAPTLLASAYRNSLALARGHGLPSIAFPCLSTGIFGYPAAEACGVAIQAVKQDLEQRGGLERVVFCTYLASDFALYQQQLR
jgi:O-acetyl-ADP-ribose deacetylase (regulator of RNase III)